MIDYWQIYEDGDYDNYRVSVLCGGCDRDVDFVWVEGSDHRVLPAKCPECGWVPTKICP